MSQYYKVINISDHPLHINWNIHLLSGDDLEAYNAYKFTPEYVGYNDEEKASRKKVAEEVRSRPFFENFDKDLKIKIIDRVMEGKISTTRTRYEWHFCIGPDIDLILEQDNLVRTRQTCELYNIPFTARETLQELTNKMLKYFGPNIRVLTSEQWNESGLKDHLNKVLEIKQKNGNEIKLVNTGRLNIEELTDTEAYEYLNLNNDEEVDINSATNVDGTLNSNLHIVSQNEVDELKKQVEDLKDMINNRPTSRPRSRVKKSFVKANESIQPT